MIRPEDTQYARIWESIRKSRRYGCGGVTEYWHKMIDIGLILLVVIALRGTDEVINFGIIIATTQLLFYVGASMFWMLWDWWAEKRENVGDDGTR